MVIPEVLMVIIHGIETGWKYFPAVEMCLIKDEISILNGEEMGPIWHFVLCSLEVKINEI